MAYRRLRADYDYAYARLCAEEPNQQRFAEALAFYRECRDRLARLLVVSEAGNCTAVRVAPMDVKAAFRPSSTC